jgi:hypothetical protein
MKSDSMGNGMMGVKTEYTNKVALCLIINFISFFLRVFKVFQKFS